MKAIRFLEMSSSTMLILLILCFGCGSDSIGSFQNNDLERRESVLEIDIDDLCEVGTLGESSSPDAIAQSFVLDFNQTITAVDIELSRVGHFTNEGSTEGDMIFIWLGNNNGNSPDQTLGEGSGLINYVVHGSRSTTRLYFDSEIELLRDVKYWIVVELQSDGIQPDPGNSNYINFYYNNSSSIYSDGYLIFKEGDSWGNTDYGDLSIQLWALVR